MTTLKALSFLNFNAVDRQCVDSSLNYYQLKKLQ